MALTNKSTWGGPALNCPLCCSKTFNSKQSLIDHLTIAAENLYCPICATRFTSVVHLTEHLSHDNCQSNDPKEAVVFFSTESQENGIKNSSVQASKVFQNESSLSRWNHDDKLELEPYEAVDGDVNKMYADLLSKQLMKPSVQMQELKLVEENGESQYLILTQDSTDGSTIVTKQNNDGTISLTSVNEMKIETDAMIAPEVEPEDNPEEIYSCNTCKVSFSSVLEHIQNYHNDQDVVVEEPIEDNENESLPVEYGTLENEDSMLSADNQAPRRVITDTGDIVEEPLLFKNDPMVQQEVSDAATQEEPKTAETRVYAESATQIENDVIVNEIPPTDGKSGGPYHKVIVKELQTESGLKIKMYECMTCNICVNNLNNFKIHPCKAMKYTCPHCPVAYENSKSLCAHMKGHKLKSVKYTCPHCPVAYENSKSLSAHMKIHKVKADTDAPTSYECEICNTVFLTNKSLKLHKRMHDPIKARPIDPPIETNDGNVGSVDRYHCTVCDKMIPEDYRSIHQASHKNSDKMNCTVCNKKFLSAEYLEMHMNVHNLDKVPISKQDKSLPYCCLYCNRRFARPHEKVKHERIHTGEKPHSCEICGKSFRVSYCLTLHMRTHTGARPYACAICNKRFKAHSVYNHHLLTHSEVRAYKCPYCPKAFKTSVQLAGHKNSHTKPFSCQHCNRPFASLYAVRVHTETHARTNNLKFACSLCGASYARAFALKDHVKQVHKKDVDNIDVGLNKDEEWTVNENTEADSIHPLSKDLPQDIDLEMNANELIVP